MKFKLCIFLAVIFLYLAFSFAIAEEDPYVIVSGDVLTIIVLGHDNLTITTTVGPDGNISFSYLGIIKAEGLTLAQLKERLVNALSPNYIRFPEVSVRLDLPKSQKFYVYGEVARPGVYKLEEQTTVLKAISMAGGLGKFASTGKVKILRAIPDKSNYQKIIVNLNQVINVPQRFPDTIIKNNDIIVVNER